MIEESYEQLHFDMQSQLVQQSRIIEDLALQLKEEKKRKPPKVLTLDREKVRVIKQ